MSIIEQVKELRYQADVYNAVGSAWELNYTEAKKLQQALRQAADTIESLSDKLQAENMKRSSEDCGGWIPCKEILPKKDGFYIATLDGEIVGEDKPFSGTAEFKDRKWVDDEEDYQCVLAWMPLPEPYHEP